MVRKLTSHSSLENLKREAKRWLAALRDDDPEARRKARERLERATPNAPSEPSLRHLQHALAREHGLPSWSELKAQFGRRTPADPARAELVARFVDNACPDHHVRGGTAHIRAWHTAKRLLDRYPDIATDSFYTAIACGDTERVRQTLDDDPQAATEKGGPKGWDPILYLCFSRAPLAAASDNALTIARTLLDAGADPNAYFMAGGSRYTPLVGVVGEGEEDRPAHLQRDALTRLLLERGANPFDIQVIYNTGFHGRVLWFLEMIYEESVKRGRQADWSDPEWEMLGMGGYGTGARWMLNVAMRNNDLALARWVLEHGANPNAGPPRAKRLSHESIYEQAVRNGYTEMAALLVEFGAVATAVILEPIDQFTAAVSRLDSVAARELLAAHPEVLTATKPIFALTQRDRVDAVALLLDLGTSPDVEDEEHQRALHVAAYHNAPHVARLLLDRGAAVDPVHSAWNNTPLGAATYSQHPEMIELLAKVSRDIWELTYGGHIDRLREVLQSDPGLARTTGGGHTLLMWLPPNDATRATEVATLLLAYGADPKPKNKDGQTAADRARELGLFDVAEMLERASA